MGPMVGSSVGKEGAGEEGGRESSEEPRKLAEAVQHSSSVKESFTVNVRRNEFGEVMDVNEYHIVRELGAGAFASVYLCTTTAASAAALSPSSSSLLLLLLRFLFGKTAGRHREVDSAANGR